MPRQLFRRQQPVAAYERAEGPVDGIAPTSPSPPPFSGTPPQPIVPAADKGDPAGAASVGKPARYGPQHRRVPGSPGSYPSDLTDAEWEQVRPLIEDTEGRGRPPTQDRRRILDALFYIARTGCQWRMLPHDYPPWQTVASCFYRWMRRGVLPKVYAKLRGTYRQAVGRQEQNSAGIIDSQTIKTTEKGGPTGFDGGKRIKGRKRHLFVDTLGLLVSILVLPANISDGEGAKQLLQPIHWMLSRMKKLWVDGGYKEGFQLWVEKTTGWKVEVTRRPGATPTGTWGPAEQPEQNEAGGFKVIPWRWIVERTLGWMGRYRRLSKDYEKLPSSSESWIWISMTRLLLLRLGSLGGQV